MTRDDVFDITKGKDDTKMCVCDVEREIKVINANVVYRCLDNKTC